MQRGNEREGGGGSYLEIHRTASSARNDHLRASMGDSPHSRQGSQHHQQVQDLDDDDGRSDGDDSMYMSQSGRLAPSGGDENFKVVVRLRPPLARELQAAKPFQNIVLVHKDGKALTVSENLNLVQKQGPGTPRSTAAESLVYATHQFTFDHVYDQQADQKSVYEGSAKQAVLSTLLGYNATMIAYGQTGTGKTYTMEGIGSSPDLRGIIPRAIEDVFKYIQNDQSTGTKYLVRAAYLQIYNEVISDLLKPERTNLHIREDKKRGVFVEGLSEWVVRSPAEISGLMERGAAVRATGATRMNEISSRSHAVFIIIAENSTTQVEREGEDDGWGDEMQTPTAGSRAGGTKQSFKVGKLNLVDLAGSERVRITGATGKRLEESKKINQSLSALGNVIAALTDAKGRQHIPYRDSKLTRILEDSLGGNCKTTMMAMISPALEAFLETLSTLKFANRAKNIKNQACVNEDVDQKTLLRKYERELRKLRAELEQRQSTLVDKRRILEMEEQKRRAEEDKLAAIIALEERSRDFMREKESKLKLEARIKTMQSQLLIGGHTIEDTPAFRTLLQEEHRKIRREYDHRLQELEKERHTVEEDKAQVGRYKQLLLKQRDIMMQLTARLNERDEQILVLQEELEAYDRLQRKLEDTLDQKTAELIQLRKAAMEFGLDRPPSGGAGGQQPSQQHLRNKLVEAVWGGAAVAAMPIAAEVQDGPAMPVVSDVTPSLSRNASSGDLLQEPMLASGDVPSWSSAWASSRPPSANSSATPAGMSPRKATPAAGAGGSANYQGMQPGQGLPSSGSATWQQQVPGAAGVGGASEVGGSAVPSVTSGSSREEITRQLEMRVEGLLQQHSQFRRDVASQLDEKDKLLRRHADENRRLRQMLARYQHKEEAANSNGSSQGAGAEPSRRGPDGSTSGAAPGDPTSSGSSRGGPDVSSAGGAVTVELHREVSVLRDKCHTHRKERAALKTILDSKIRVLVASLCLSTSEMPADLALQHPRFVRDLHSLDKLVAATVHAMG
eukprot:jgi/Mesvir1/20241/Mv13477-RA.3